MIRKYNGILLFPSALKILDKIRGDIGAVLREDHACVSIIALLAEQAQAIIEAVDVPRILQGERDLGLGKDGIEVLGLILGDLGLVVVHEHVLSVYGTP